MFNSKKLTLQLEFNRTIIEQIEASELKKNIVIGRHEDCDWQIPPADKTASNRHAEIYRKGGGFFIRDCGSRNGVFYRGERIKEHKLAPGDRYGIGDAALVVLESREASGQAVQKYHRLEQMNGKNRGKVYELKEKEYIIGSDPSQAQIVCQEQLVSRTHAKVFLREDGSCWLVNMESRNGVQINQMTLTKNIKEGRMLRDGDVISLANIDFKFYDKNVVTLKSHFWLKAITAICTIIIAISAYFIYQSTQPSARDYIDLARQYAEAEKFDEALRILDKATNARHYSTFAVVQAELAKNIKEWKGIRSSWESVKGDLAKQKWVTANKELMPLVLAKQEIWNWNDAAEKDKKEAVWISELNETMLRTRTSFENNGTAVGVLNENGAQLKAILDKAPATIADYMKPLIDYSREVLKENDAAIEQDKKLSAIISSYAKLSDTGMVQVKLEEMQRQIAEHIKALEKKGLRYSPTVANTIETYVKPVAQLRKSNELLGKNYDNIAIFNFKKLAEDIELPSAKLCAVNPVFSEKRHQMENQNKRILEVSRQLGALVENLAKKGVVSGKRPDDIVFTYSEEAWRNVLACDCLRHPPREWTWNRKKPIGDYDKMLCIEVFRDFVSSLNMEAPVDFDRSLLDERGFIPVLPCARVVFSDLLMFQGFLKNQTLQELMTRPLPQNSLLELALWVDTLLAERDAFVKSLMERSRKAASDREAIILGGAALILAKAPTIDFKDDYGRLATLYRKNRSDVEAQARGEGRPEEILEGYRKILAIGLPGDALVKQALQETFGK